ncbi:kinase-like domain-containing protein [Mycena sp. CBHHK59/15]|nr:kinase-like domain-containing protein [Mycena sp. CBHHK59/15]
MLCRKRSTNKIYVIKALENCNGLEPHVEQVVLEAVLELRAPFLERIHWIFPGFGEGEERRIYLVLDSHPGGSLVALRNTRSITLSDALFYASEIVDAVSSLHAANIIHRDVTPSNILVDHMGHLVLSNFCNATIFSPSKRCQENVPSSAAVEYQAPEILLGWTHDFAVDCWSLGNLFHFLLAGKVSTPISDGISTNLCMAESFCGS